VATYSRRPEIIRSRAISSGQTTGNTEQKVAPTMSTDKFQSELPIAALNLKANVSISRWANEAYPPWNEILSSHDVARLTRRHRWILSAMAALRRFPHKRKFHGRAVGWHRGDVVRWLANRHSRLTPPQKPATLPLPFPAAPDARSPRHAGLRLTGARPVRRRRAQSIKRTVTHPASPATEDGTRRIGP
jgi:predicted DNA-binding transcriptional regulator AlpA